MNRGQNKQGFTIVELLIVIVVIGVLAAITTIAFRGIQDRASDVSVISDISAALKKLELYKAEFGAYPITGWNNARTDQNCLQQPQYVDWIPGITGLPQSKTVKNPIIDGWNQGVRGCYLYASDGQQYIISGWGMMEQDRTGNTGYRLVGFREMEISVDRTPGYMCNHATINGNGYYRYSYTLTNIPTTSCS